MRIIGGKAAGRILHPPNSLKLRPTTDRARESLFQLMENLGGMAEKSVLDLFSGTGSIGLECASRGAARVVCVDRQTMALRFIAQSARTFGWPVETLKADVLRFLKVTGHETFDIIFADPPYDASFLPELPALVLQSKRLKHDGLFILEHGNSNRPLLPDCFQERKYGHVHFSFYRSE